ncbi:MAG: hypothetical protein OHK0046_37690 [Anaerolineae bacterium]
MSQSEGFNERWQEIRRIWHRHQWLYGAVGFLGGLLFLPLLQLLASDAFQLLEDLVPEALGITFTVLFIDAIYQRREVQREKERLIREMNNQNNGIVMRAVEELRANDWLEDGSLYNARMGDVNLKGVNLKRANLYGVRFLTDRQLVQAQRLWLAVMPDGTRYNGRFNLLADIARAKENGVDVHDPVQMARDYQVSVEEYLNGQKWANENSEWLNSLRTPLEADEI